MAVRLRGGSAKGGGSSLNHLADLANWTLLWLCSHIPQKVTEFNSYPHKLSETTRIVEEGRMHPYVSVQSLSKSMAYKVRSRSVLTK